MDALELVVLLLDRSLDLEVKLGRHEVVEFLAELFREPG